MGQSIVAETFDATIAAVAHTRDRGTIDLATNAISAIESERPGVAINFSAALANNQTNLGTDVSATLSFGAIRAEAGFNGSNTTGCLVSVNDNRAKATAFGNETGQTLALNANDLSFAPGVASLSGGAVPDGNVSALGTATIANLQTNCSSDVKAGSVSCRVQLRLSALATMWTAALWTSADASGGPVPSAARRRTPSRSPARRRLLQRRSFPVPIPEVWC